MSSVLTAVCKILGVTAIQTLTRVSLDLTKFGPLTPRLLPQPHSVRLLSVVTMPYRYIHPEQKRLLAVMSAKMTSQDIADKTNISKRTVQRTLKTWQDTGDVVQRFLPRGRPRALNPIELCVRLSLLLYEIVLLITASSIWKV